MRKLRISKQDNISKPASIRHYVHGLLRKGAKHPIHCVYASMLDRCHNPNAGKFSSYGGRGIKVCKRWLRFKNFISDMGPKPTQSHQLERINNNGNYSPKNCRWATRKQQARNRRDNRILELNGKKATLAEWCEITGMGQKTITNRIDKTGWTVRRALITPTRSHKPYGKIKKQAA